MGVPNEHISRRKMGQSMQLLLLLSVAVSFNIVIAWTSNVGEYEKDIHIVMCEYMKGHFTASCPVY